MAYYITEKWQGDNCRLSLSSTYVEGASIIFDSEEIAGAWLLYTLNFHGNVSASGTDIARASELLDARLHRILGESTWPI
jgi:uncharacterized protein YfaP (DUF2135 family)